MVDIHDVHLGNWVQVEVEGERLTGKVERKSVERIGVEIKKELGWYYPNEVFPILLDEEWLKYFDFVLETSENGSLVYRHGHTTFTLTYPDKENKNLVVLDCHGSHSREFEEGLFVHNLQNHYHGMTKVFIE